jgi:hypothetical protein
MPKRVVKAAKAASKVMKMLGGGDTCPPGVWCMDTSVLVLTLILVAVLAYIAYQIHSKPASTMSMTNTKPTVIVVKTPTPQVQTIPFQADPRFAPMSPERSYTAPPDPREMPAPPLSGGGIPINIATRGIPEQYQQIGVLTAPGGSDTSASPTRTILPLFGRKVITNRDRWNYYTRTDGMNPVQVPLQFKRRNCDDDNGCDEIMDGDSISVPVLGQSYVASVYRYSTPKYIPF